MPNEVDSGGEESPGVLSDDHDHPPDSPDSNSTDPPDTNKGFPWLKVLATLSSPVSRKFIVIWIQKVESVSKSF